MSKDLISRQAAIEALGERPMVWTDDDHYALGERNQYDMDKLAIETVPSAQPTLCGYNMEHLELIARVLQKEDFPPERVAEVLTDIGGIVAMVKDEIEQALRKQAIERMIRLTWCKTNEDITARMDASVTDSEGWLGGVAACIDELEDMQGEWEAKK